MIGGREVQRSRLGRYCYQRADEIAVRLPALSGSKQSAPPRLCERGAEAARSSYICTVFFESSLEGPKSAESLGDLSPISASHPPN